jgi:hypothetical protein
VKDCVHLPEIGGGHRPAQPKSLPQVWELREYLNYNEETGELTWKKSPARRVKVGDVAGTTIVEGYKRFKFKGRNHAAHRIAFAIVHGYWPTPGCDHINGNTLDNRARNLREARHAQNMWNKRVGRNNKSGIKGVHWHKLVGKWVASIKRDGKTIVAGYYQDLAAAADAVAKLREKFHGDFARHATQH